jgi:hypothetical protein
MAKKGKEKNTLNKAKHKKLMARKLNKIKSDKLKHKARLKEITRLANEKNAL